MDSVFQFFSFLVFQFFSFLVLLHHRAGTTVQLFVESLFNTCHSFCIYYILFIYGAPPKEAPKI